MSPGGEPVPAEADVGAGQGAGIHPQCGPEDPGGGQLDTCILYIVTRVTRVQCDTCFQATHLETLWEGVEHDNVPPLDPAPGHGVVAAVRVDAGLHPGPGVLDLCPGSSRW